MTHRYQVQRRRADIDAYGHVNNVTFVDYLDEALGDLLSGLRPTWHGIVASHQLTYLSPLAFGPEPVQVSASVVHLGTTDFTLRQSVEHGTRTYLTAVTRIVATVGERPVPLGEAEREALTGLMT